MPRRKAPITFEILNERDISAFFVELGKVPQKSVRKAAKAGATMIKQATVNSSQLPVKDGFLRMSIQPFEEKVKKGKRNTSGKAGFDIGFDHRFNSIFQKEYKGTPRRGSKNPRSGDKAYYYPASMEYGFATTKGGVGGHYFLKRSAESVATSVQVKMLTVLSKDIDNIKKGR